MAFNNAQAYGNSGDQEDQKLWQNDPEVTSMRTYIRGLIAQKLSTAPPLSQQIYDTLMSTFDKRLLEEAASKEEYMNKETLDQRVESLLQKAELRGNSSSSNQVISRHGMPRNGMQAPPRSQLAGHTIPYPQHNIATTPYSYSHPMVFMGRSGDVPMEQYMPHPWNNQVGHPINIHPHTVPGGSYPNVSLGSDNEQLMQPQLKMQRVCQSQQKPLQSYMPSSQPLKTEYNIGMYEPFVQDDTQWLHQHSRGFHRVQATTAESFSSAPIGCHMGTTDESECAYCHQFPGLFDNFKNRTNPSFREKNPKLCMYLDILTSHLRNCHNHPCGCCEKYRLIYQHFVDCYRFAYNEHIKRLAASQNCDSGSSKRNRGMQRTHNDGEVGQPTSMEFQRLGHPFPPHSSSLNESSQVATSIDQRHSEERLPRMLQQQLPMPLVDQTKVTELNMESFIDPAQGDKNLSEMKNNQSEGSLQVVNETHVEGRMPEKMKIEGASLIEPFTPNQIKERA